MARPATPVDYHVVPRVERGSHKYEGHECACEPRCVLMGPSTRVFVHQTHVIDVLKVVVPTRKA